MEKIVKWMFCTVCLYSKHSHSALVKPTSKGRQLQGVLILSVLPFFVNNLSPSFSI